MMYFRGLLAACAATALSAPLPAGAQFFFRSHDMTAPPITESEPSINAAFPGATPAEIRAALVWRMRAALNVAALQCQFEPTLLSVPNYNAILFNHKDEFGKAYATLGKYFIRVAKSPKIGQNALDRFGTRTYSQFTTVRAQYNFCQTSSVIGARAAFAPRGEFYTVALRDTGTLANSLSYYGEQAFSGRLWISQVLGWPNLDPQCWDRRGNWIDKRCGAFDPDYTLRR